MRAAIYREFEGPIDVEILPDPQVPPDGVVVEVKANGICRSDWHGWKGHDPDIRLPHVPGHELAGIVAETGREVQRFKPGDRVTVPFACGCGTCPQCLSGNQQICDNYFQPGFSAWGSFAQYVALRYADVNLVHLPDGMDFSESASLGCRFTTAFRAVLQQGRAEPGEWVAVHGCGGLGLAAVMIANAVGANVIAVDVKEEALEMARQLGACQAINAGQESRISRAIRDGSGGGVHLSLDTLGSIETCRNSVLGLRKRGRHIQVGLMVADYRDAPVPMNQVIAKELEIYGSHGMAAHAYPQLFQMIASGYLNPAALIRKKVSLAEAPAELVAMGEFKGVGVTVIDRF